MISQETCRDIWLCYREIAAGEKLLADMAEQAKRESSNPEAKYQPSLRNAFGEKRNLQLGIPSGQDCHRLFDVSPLLAESIVRAHITNKRAELETLNERARVEVNTIQSPNPESNS